MGEPVSSGPSHFVLETKGRLRRFQVAPPQLLGPLSRKMNPQATGNDKFSAGGAYIAFSAMCTDNPTFIKACVAFKAIWTRATRDDGYP